MSLPLLILGIPKLYIIANISKTYDDWYLYREFDSSGMNGIDECRTYKCDTIKGFIQMISGFIF